MADEDKVRGVSPHDLRRILTKTKDAFITSQLDITAAGTAEQLPDVSVPDGCKLTVIAKPGNTGIVYFSFSKDDCEDTAVRFDGLAAGLAHSFNVSNANLIWIDVETGHSGEGVSYYVEQD